MEQNFLVDQFFKGGPMMWAMLLCSLLALGVIGYLAIRRLRLAWWQRLVALGAEALLGVLTAGLQLLAHG